MKVVLLVVDSLRGDVPGFAGGEASTPTFDALARSGVCFARGFCSGSWTIPSLVAMTTALHPHRVGVCNWRHAPPPAQPTLFTAFQDAGFSVSAFVPNPAYAFGGWSAIDHVGDVQDGDAVLRALRAPGDALVVVHHWSTHIPYVTAPASWGGLKKAAHALLAALHGDPTGMAPKCRALYLRAVHHWSEEVLARQLEAAGPDALVLVTADHGEQWGESLPAGRRIEHVYDLHGRWLDDATTRVPFVVAGRSLRGTVPSRTPSAFARGIDVAPTLCALAGLDRWAADGATLDGVLFDDDPGPSEALTVRSHNTHEPEVYPPDGAAMWRAASLRTEDGRWTWDRRSDVWESAPHAAVRARVDALLSTARGPTLRPGAEPPGEEGMRERLGMLGYLE